MREWELLSKWKLCNCGRMHVENVHWWENVSLWENVPRVSPGFNVSRYE